MKREFLNARLKDDAVKIFNAAVDAVIPNKAINRIVNVQENTLHVENKSYILHKNVYLVGFGKAVACMAKAVEDALKHHLVAGIISVPEGTTSIPDRRLLPSRNGKIKIMEGAKNNLPDEKALQAAQEITNFVSQCPADSLLIVLISGGGSALLPLPLPPVTLEEKQAVTKLLSKNGADILELNTVRKRLSLVKGGGIVLFSTSSKILGLILSDVIGDDIEFIASGPTVINTDDSEAALKIFKQYKLFEHIPESVQQVLQQKTSSSAINYDFSRVQNVLIGTNRIALEAAACESRNMGYASLVLTTALQGESRICGQALASLADILYQEFSSKTTNWNDANVQAIANGLGILPENVHSAINHARIASEHGTGLCVLCGGETTVTVVGNGIGGRNQELALAFGIKLDEFPNTKSDRLILLSSGTDGFDGPNDAAGAFGFPLLKTESEMCGLTAEDYLRNNDSYNFYELLCDGEYHLKTGHTGTNVMDVQVLLMNNN